MSIMMEDLLPADRELELYGDPEDEYFGDPEFESASSPAAEIRLMEHLAASPGGRPAGGPRLTRAGSRVAASLRRRPRRDRCRRQRSR